MGLEVVEETVRGFEIIKFDDRYGVACSLQQSSMAGEDDELPGHTAIWLGPTDGDPKIMKSKAESLGVPLPPGEVSGWMPYPIPEEVLLTTRMHLHRDLVVQLVHRLNNWLETGSFESR
jgi:hypothetical protein